MDLDLSDEQIWLSESIETLLDREWTGAAAAHDAGEPERRRLWHALVEFGALSIERDEGLGAVELCLAARAVGAHLASAPYIGSTALRFAVEPHAADLPERFAELTGGDERVSIALLEPRGGWSPADVRASLGADGLRGDKVAVEHGDEVELLAVVAVAAGAPTLAIVPAGAPGVHVSAQPSFDVTVPMSAVRFAGATPAAVASAAVAGELLARVTAIGALLAAAESVGAATAMLDDARRYASERRQFGRTIGSNQALRHLLADMYVRQSSAWSTVLYAAAALDDDLADAHQTAAVAKAYVARAAREVAHGAMQVFGGIAFTEEHSAHRFLRRIVVREQQFGDAAHHERELGRMLAERAAGRPQSATTPITPAPVS
jgi:alkylation response protein AidB-like acyl-CoA dehydrogenase